MSPSSAEGEPGGSRQHGKPEQGQHESASTATESPESALSRRRGPEEAGALEPARSNPLATTEYHQSDSGNQEERHREQSGHLDSLGRAELSILR